VIFVHALILLHFQNEELQNCACLTCDFLQFEPKNWKAMRSEQIVELKVVGTIFAGDWSGRHLGNIAIGN